MKNVTIDMSPVVHGSRAIRRCTACMVEELIKFEDMALELLYFDYKHQRDKYLRPNGNHIKETVIPIPCRLLIPFWKRYSFPYLEAFFCKGDLFYTNSFYFPPSKKAITIATIHGLSYKAIPDKLPFQNVDLYEQGLLFILKHADYLIAVSETTKKELIRYAEVYPERIYVVTHGVDNQFRRLENRQTVWNQLNIDYGLNHPYILYVGAIGIHKNISGILSAYSMLSHELPHHLVLAGPQDSAWRDANQFVTEKNMTEKVHFLGHVYDTDKLVNLYNGADLFVFPSFYEGWTSPPLEAMACGTPVITSNCSSLPETVGEAAVKVDPNHIESLAEQMERVLSDKTLQLELIKKGFEHVSKHTWEKAAEKLIHVFEDILSKGPWQDRKV